MIKNALLNRDFFQRRIVKAYDYFGVQREELKEKIDEIKKKVQKSESVVLYGTICSVVSTIILSLMTKDYKLWFTTLVPLGFFIDIVIYNVRRKK